MNRDQLVRDYLGRRDGYKHLANAMISPIEYRSSKLTQAEISRVEMLVYLAVQNKKVVDYKSADELTTEIRNKIVAARFSHDG